MELNTLTNWKTQLEQQLKELEMQISKLDNERRRIREQLGALATLISAPNGNTKNEKSQVVAITETDAISDFLSALKIKGWSVTQSSGRRKIYVAERSSQKILFWIKFSMYHKEVDYYWFGIMPVSLDSMLNENGAVILLLNSSQRYLCIPFAHLNDLLKNATTAKTGKKFTIREMNQEIKMLPIGTGEWVDVTSFYDGKGLHHVGL